MRRSTVIAAVLGALLLASGASGEQASSPGGGLYGVVMKGPTMPVCRDDVPCEAPAAGTTLTFSRARARAGHVRTNANGAYRISLSPGTYTVRTDAAPFGTVPQPERVRVGAYFSRVNFSIDTGIRVSD